MSLAKVGMHQTILYPLITEDAVALIETENKLVFVVNKKATKYDIKYAVESLYQVEVDKVNVLTTPQVLKKAFVRLNPKYQAANLAIKLGIL